MSQSLAKPQDCCTPCPDVSTTSQIPGPAGPAGTAGTNGTNGGNSYTTTTANFTMPAVGANVVLSVGTSAWAVIGQKSVVEGAGYFDVAAKPTSTQLTLTNLGYAGNVAPGTVVPSPKGVSPGGIKGTDGAAGSTTLNILSPTTTKGDIIVDNGANSPTAGDVRLGVGTNGKAIVADSTQATGLNYTAITPNTITNDKNIPRYNGTSGTPMPLQDSKLLITDDGAIQSTPTGGNARGSKAVDLQTSRAAATQVSSATLSTIGGGENNTASGQKSVVAGGSANTASGSAAAVLGGLTNTASNTGSAVVAGNTNAATGTGAFVGGGASNTASGPSSGILSGNAALADKHGQISHASSNFSAQGDAQTSELLWNISTTDATANVEMFLDGSTLRATVPNNTSWVFEILLIARSSAGVSAAWRTTGAIQLNGGVVSLVAAVATAVLADGSGGTFGVAGNFLVDALPVINALRLRVTGSAATNIRWTAHARIVEVGY